MRSSSLWFYGFALVATSGCGSRGPGSTSSTAGTLAAPSAVFNSEGAPAGSEARALTDLEMVNKVVLTTSGDVLVATDRGLFRFHASDPAVAVTSGANVRALAAHGDGFAYALDNSVGVSGVELGAPSAELPAAPVGTVTDLAWGSDADLALWACGSTGLARYKKSATAWERVGDAFSCTTLTPTDEGALWVGAATGLFMVDGEVMREHAASRGLPEARVRDVVPLFAGQSLALLQGPRATQLGFFDGSKWYAYTTAQIRGEIVDLVRVGREVVLLTREAAYKIVLGDSGGGAIPFRARSASSDGVVRSFRPTTGEAAAVDFRVAAAAEPTVFEDEPAEGTDAREAPVVSFAPFAVGPAEPGQIRMAHGAGTLDAPVLFLVRPNVGVTAVRGAESVRYATRSLLVSEDIQVASDAAGRNFWLVSPGVLAVHRGETVKGYSIEGFVPTAVASGREGAYLIGLVDEPPAPVAEAAPRGRARRGRVAVVSQAPRQLVRAYVVKRGGLEQLFERPLTLAAGQTAAGFGVLAISPEGDLWATLKVTANGNTFTRGLAVFPKAAGVIFHHRGATAAADGQGAVSCPDEITALEFDAEGHAWAASLSGAVRFADGQAIVFGESRGVRGETVSDLVAGTAGRVWAAASEGLGVYHEQAWSFALPEIARDFHPAALAFDTRGNLWAAGENGLLKYDGTHWVSVLSGTAVRDIEAERDGTVVYTTPVALVLVP